MKHVPATDVVQHFCRAMELARREPITITSDGQASVVLLGADEYRRLKRRDREVYGLEELPPALVEAIGRAEMDAEHSLLDDLLNK